MKIFYLFNAWALQNEGDVITGRNIKEMLKTYIRIYKSARSSVFDPDLKIKIRSELETIGFL